MQEYISVPWQKLIVDNQLSAKELAMVEPLTVGFHAIDRGRVTDIDTVMVFGCGMIGSGAIIRAALRGAKVIAVDVDDEKLALAKKIGATHCINSKAVVSVPWAPLLMASAMLPMPSLPWSSWFTQ